MTKVNGSPKKIEYQCNECQDVGWIISDKGARECKCRESTRYKDILKHSGISEAFQKKTLNNYIVATKVQEIAVNQAKRYINEFEKIRNERNNSIAFLKQVGAGKTHLSIAICNELMKKNIGCRYLPYREVVTHIKQLMTDEESYQKEISTYKNAPVLLIDDLFKGRTTESDINIMYEILNHRYLKQMPIIVSSEYDTDKLLDFDEAIGSRIIEMCKGRIIEFNGSELNHRLG